MKKILVILGAVLISPCQSDKNETIGNDNVIKVDTIRSPQQTKHNCDCSRLDTVRWYPRGPRFQNYDNVKEIKSRNDSEWRKYSNDSLRLTVRAIELWNYDTIPNKFGIFENVEKITLSARHGIKGLDIFPNLMEVEFFESVIEIDTTEKWVQRIEIFSAGKTKIEQLKSFQYLPNLVRITMSFSGFDKFPSDIESLNCLKELEFGAYMFGPLDLGTIDLSKFSCLKKVTFQTWYESLTGIPKGLSDTMKLLELDISHKKLTTEERAKIKKYHGRFKKASH
ncbi:MAG: hypothetical protein ABI663_11430 [Chryseolinea sp.]